MRAIKELIGLMITPLMIMRRLSRMGRERLQDQCQEIIENDKDINFLKDEAN